jgi:hypothetical protein
MVDQRGNTTSEPEALDRWHDAKELVQIDRLAARPMS